MKSITLTDGSMSLTIAETENYFEVSGGGQSFWPFTENHAILLLLCLDKEFPKGATLGYAENSMIHLGSVSPTSEVLFLHNGSSSFIVDRLENKHRISIAGSKKTETFLLGSKEITALTNFCKDALQDWPILED